MKLGKKPKASVFIPLSCIVLPSHCHTAEKERKENVLRRSKNERGKDRGKVHNMESHIWEMDTVDTDVDI